MWKAPHILVGSIFMLCFHATCQLCFQPSEAPSTRPFTLNVGMAIFLNHQHLIHVIYMILQCIFFPCIHTNTKKTHRKDLRTFYIRSCASTHHQKHISYIYHISMSKKKHKNIHPSLWAMLGQSRTWKFLTNFISEIRQGCHGDVHGLHLLRLSLQLLCGDGHPSLHSGLGETSWGSSKLYLID